MEIPREKIKKKAYELYLARVAKGAHHGNDMEDWFAAETEINNNMTTNKKGKPKAKKK